MMMTMIIYSLIAILLLFYVKVEKLQLIIFLCVASYVLFLNGVHITLRTKEGLMEYYTYFFIGLTILSISLRIVTDHYQFLTKVLLSISIFATIIGLLFIG